MSNGTERERGGEGRTHRQAAAGSPVDPIEGGEGRGEKKGREREREREREGGRVSVVQCSLSDYSCSSWKQ